MRPNARPSDILVDSSGRSTSIMQKILNFVRGLANGELQTIETDANVTNTKYGTIYLVDTSSGNRAVNLPDLTIQQKTKWIVVKNTGTGFLTLDGFLSQTIDGSTTVVLSENVFVTVMNTRTEWKIIGA